MDFVKVFQEIHSLDLTIAKKQRELAEKLQALNDVCKTICTSAAKKCNQNAQLRIVLDKIHFGIAVGAKKIDMRVRLQYLNGDEPDEDMGDGEFHNLESRYRTALDKELRAADIPLTLGTLLAPPEYYPK